MQCANCQKNLGFNAPPIDHQGEKYCFDCFRLITSGKLVPQPRTPVVPVAAPVVSPFRTCSYCGKEVPNSATICMYCQATLTPYQPPAPLRPQPAVTTQAPVQLKRIVSIKFYNSENQMTSDLNIMQLSGWEVIDTEFIDRGYGCMKTGCLGSIFLPLALAGKKSKQIKVTYQRYIPA